MGSMGASVLKILQNAIASVSLVTQLVGASVVFSVSFLSGLLCRERQTGSDHRCHQWHWHRTDLGGQPPRAVSAQQAPPPTAEGERTGPHHHHGIPGASA